MPTGRVRTPTWSDGAVLIGDAAHAMKSPCLQDACRRCGCDGVGGSVAGMPGGGDYCGTAQAVEHERRLKSNAAGRRMSRCWFGTRPSRDRFCAIRVPHAGPQPALRYRVLSTTAGFRSSPPFTMADRLMAAGFCRSAAQIGASRAGVQDVAVQWTSMGCRTRCRDCCGVREGRDQAYDQQIESVLLYAARFEGILPGRSNLNILLFVSSCDVACLKIYAGLHKKWSQRASCGTVISHSGRPSGRRRSSFRWSTRTSGMPSSTMGQDPFIGFKVDQRHLAGELLQS